MDQSAVIKLCKESGCCDACCLRYIGLKNPTVYHNPQKYILKFQDQPVVPLVADILTYASTPAASSPAASPATDISSAVSPHAVSSSTTSPIAISPAVGSAPAASPPVASSPAASPPISSPAANPAADVSKLFTNGSASPPAKRRRPDVCVSCLGVLQEHTWPQCYEMVREMLDKKRYENESFACALSAPISTLLREKALTLALREAVPDYDARSLTPLKEAWKWSFGPRLAQHVGKTLDSGAVAPLLLTLNMEYPDDLQELEVLKTVSPALFESRSRQRRRFAVQFTRRCVEQALEGASREALRGAAFRPSAGVACVSAEGAHSPVYLGGRYIKLSRSLPQTPWLVNGRRMLESSVQELICAPLAELLGIPREDTERRLKFMSAGREDVDVRCLGAGRPFALEVSDPRRRLSEPELRRACELISAGGQVRVRRLVHVSKDELAKLKQGEETKCKTYEALCIKLAHGEDEPAAAAAPVTVTEQDIARIAQYRNTPAGEGARVLLAQRTPLRVLHRRPLLTRARRLLELSAARVPGHPALFVVRVRAEAGTYVKEWAHGELGRTRPSLRHALGAPADILALDVACVELAWPPGAADADEDAEGDGADV